jgi:nitrous oxidase accessory protein
VRNRVLGILAAVTVGALLVAAPASGARIDVHTGKNAIQRAINRADRGDTLRIHAGTYSGALRVTKRLKLVGVGGRPTIDAGCADDIALDVQAPGVVLDHLKVTGATEGYAVNFIGLRTGTAQDLVVKQTCKGGSAPAEYGINIFDSGNIVLRGNRMFGGFTDAGIYVGGIVDTSAGPLLVVGNNSYGNNRGIILEDSFGVDMRVRDNRTHDNTIGGEGVATGIYVHNSDDLVLTGNRAIDNGDFGIHVDPNSDDNVLRDNVARGSGTVDLKNDGNGTCGSGNSFETTAGTPLVPCG